MRTSKIGMAALTVRTGRGSRSRMARLLHHASTSSSRTMVRRRLVSALLPCPEPLLIKTVRGARGSSHVGQPGDKAG